MCNEYPLNHSVSRRIFFPEWSGKKVERSGKKGQGMTSERFSLLIEAGPGDVPGVQRLRALLKAMHRRVLGK